MNFRNCKYFSEIINSQNQIWSRCSLKDGTLLFDGVSRCGIYKTEGYKQRCLGFEPTFKAMMEEAIIETENRP